MKATGTHTETWTLRCALEQPCPRHTGVFIWSFMVLKTHEFEGKAAFPVLASDPADASLVEDVRNSTTPVVTG